MKEIYRYNNIKSIFSFKNHIYFLSSEGILFRMNGCEIEKKVDLARFGGKIYPKYGHLQFYHEKSLYWITDDFEIDKLLEYDAGFIAKCGNLYYCEDRVDRKTLHIRIVEDGKVIFELTTNKWFNFIGDKFYWIEPFSNYGLNRTDVYTGRDLWSFDVRELGRYYDPKANVWKEGHLKSEAVAKDGLIILSATDDDKEGNREGRQYIALDENTGAIVWQLRNVELGSYNLQFHRDDIVVMETRTVLLIDSKKGAVIKKISFNDALVEKKVDVVNSFRVVKNKLYFFEPRHRKVVGIVNLDSFEQEHLFESEISAFQINELVTNGDYLFLLDDENNAHVYCADDKQGE